MCGCQVEVSVVVGDSTPLCKESQDHLDHILILLLGGTLTKQLSGKESFGCLDPLLQDLHRRRHHFIIGPQV